MTLTLRVLRTNLYILNMRMRMPFRYGIVTVTALPHLFVRAEVEIDGDRHLGLASDGLAIKWFTKDPNLSARDELAQIIRVVETACDVARAAGKHRSVFEWWMHTYQGMSAWAGGWGIPPLLASFGTSLLERAVIDAFCRAHDTPFAQIARDNRLGIRVDHLHPELERVEPRFALPEMPLRSVIARHTVGLADPIRESDITTDDRVNDGLPQSLEACIRAYGLSHFKIKIFGDLAKDLDRLRNIERVLRETSPDYRFTLDANENFGSVEPLRELWAALNADASLRAFMSRLLFVEQPIHRAAALSVQTTRELNAWRERPPIIIDESDAEVGSADAALAGGYAGTSHKNCKGIIKSIANACLLARRRQLDPLSRLVLSAEDLCNVGPVALQQDLAVVGALGIDHVERNGHHYYRGLSMYPPGTIEPVIARHTDLYRSLDDGTPAVRIESGRMSIGSVVDAPFGLAARFDPSGFVPLRDWTFESLGIA